MSKDYYEERIFRIIQLSANDVISKERADAEIEHERKQYYAGIREGEKERANLIRLASNEMISDERYKKEEETHKRLCELPWSPRKSYDSGFKKGFGC